MKHLLPFWPASSYMMDLTLGVTSDTGHCQCTQCLAIFELSLAKLPLLHVKQISLIQLSVYPVHLENTI